MSQPKIYNVPVEYVGARETLVIVIDGVPQSVDCWNFIEDEKRNRTFYVEGANWQLHFSAGAIVQVIR